MDDEAERSHAKLVALEQDIMNLRQSYVTVNKRYATALASLKGMAADATEAARRSAAEEAAAAVRVAAQAAAETAVMAQEASAYAKTDRR